MEKAAERRAREARIGKPGCCKRCGRRIAVAMSQQYIPAERGTRTVETCVAGHRVPLW